MKASQDFIKQLEELYQTYEQEVRGKSEEGLLTDSTARTYLLHSDNFIKWCRNDFIPGGRNANK
jgi:ABC-type Zn uptake system ZnuABC Zn-binding protein ZnuA